MPIATPEVYNQMLDTAKKGGFAFPAINCTSSETINAALRGFAEAESDGIIQFSTGGAEFGSGLSVKNKVAGAQALAAFAYEAAKHYGINVALHTDHCQKEVLDEYVRPLIAISQERVNRGELPLFQSHMWDGSAIPIDENLVIAQELLEKAHKANIILEVEIGVVGGEEDGVEAKHGANLYTSTEDFEKTVAVLVVEDTTTTGNSPLTAVAALREAGAEVIGVATIVDRATGAADAIRAQGLEYRYLIGLEDLGLA